MNNLLNLTLALTISCILATGCKKNDEGPTGTGEISMILPYNSSSDMAYFTEGFSSANNAPWGFVHNGVDFFTKSNLVPFKAVSSGKVTELNLWKNDRSINWQVNVGVKYNSLYTVVYTFEPFSGNQADGQTQLSHISVSLGQSISQGQIIGKLFTVGNGAHVHFGLNKDGTAICPESYFTPEARDSLLYMVHKFHPDWNLCY